MTDGKNAGKNRKTPRGRMEKPRGEKDGTPTQGKTGNPHKGKNAPTQRKTEKT
jgi:hypothetical protein